MYDSQYTLRDGEGGRAGIDIGRWTLISGDALDRFDIIHAGDRIGVIWGTVVDPHDVVDADGSILLPEARTLLETFEETLYQFTGRYAALLAGEGHERLYLDPGGFLPAVYRTDGEREVAASQAVLDIDYEDRFRDELYERCHSGDRIWLPGRQTYHQDVRRLLPNHYLDLETWETHRYWPREDDLPTDHDIDDAAETIISNTSAIIDRIVERYDRLYSSLTAGRDSRLLLAISREHSQRGEITYFTFGPKERLDEDIYAAERIAADVGIEWETIDRTYATEVEKEQWLRSTGHAVGGAIMEIHPTLEKIPSDARLEGLGGEVGRGFYWNESDTADSQLTPIGLLDRMTRPAVPELIGEIETWLNEVSEFDTFTTLDLAYQEFRLGCWAGPQQLGSALPIDQYCPLCYRPSIEAMHAIPPAMRAADSAVPLMIEREWPAVGKLPFNQFTDYRKYESLARTAIRNPRSAAQAVFRLLN